MHFFDLIYILLGFGLILNLLFLLVYFKCPAKSVLVKRWFILPIVIDIIQCVLQGITRPALISSECAIGTITTGIFHEGIPAAVLIHAYSLSFYAAMLMSVNSFIYLYIKVTRSSCLINHRHLIVFVSFSINFTVFAIIAVFAVISFEASWDIREDFVEIVFQEYGINVYITGMVAMDVQNPMTNLQAIAVTTNMLLLFFIFLVIIVFICKTRRFIKKNLVNPKAKLQQSQLLKLLIFMTCSPAISMYLPMIFCFSLVFLGKGIPNRLAAVVLIFPTFYPIFNPLMILYFVKDYRRFLQRLFTGEQKSTIAVANITTGNVTTGNS